MQHETPVKASKSPGGRFVRKFVRQFSRLCLNQDIAIDEQQRDSTRSGEGAAPAPETDLRLEQRLNKKWGYFFHGVHVNVGPKIAEGGRGEIDLQL